MGRPASGLIVPPSPPHTPPKAQESRNPSPWLANFGALAYLVVFPLSQGECELQNARPLPVDPASGTRLEPRALGNIGEVSELHGAVDAMSEGPWSSLYHGNFSAPPFPPGPSLHSPGAREFLPAETALCVSGLLGLLDVVLTRTWNLLCSDSPGPTLLAALTSLLQELLPGLEECGLLRTGGQHPVRVTV